MKKLYLMIGLLFLNPQVLAISEETYAVAPVLCVLIFFPMILAALIAGIYLVIKTIRMQIQEANNNEQ